MLTAAHHVQGTANVAWISEQSLVILCHKACYCYCGMLISHWQHKGRLFVPPNGIRFFYLGPFYCTNLICFSFLDKGINQYSCLYITVQYIQPLLQNVSEGIEFRWLFRACNQAQQMKKETVLFDICITAILFSWWLCLEHVAAKLRTLGSSKH
jgi:hypothetical protein